MSTSSILLGLLIVVLTGNIIVEGDSCSGGAFKCPNKSKCILSGYRCDGGNDCGDNSDEEDCKCDEENCKCDEEDCERCIGRAFYCRNARKCIRHNWKCDGDNDCGDWSDEKDCECEGIRCSNGQCISTANIRCDGSGDCDDNSDEEDCDRCKEGAFKCPNKSKCILSGYRCDGGDDCGDNSDEENCDVCVDGAFYCRNARKCIPSIRKCDGADACGDWSDEKRCVCDKKDFPEYDYEYLEERSYLPPDLVKGELVSHEIPIEQSEPRSNFPETWLWELFVVNGGVHQERLTLPDTITEWVGKAVCVHTNKGVGISPPTSITTFPLFFIDITMVPNIVKGEVMPIVVSVFNYLDTSLPVRVTVTPSPEFEIYIENNPTAVRDQSAAGKFILCVPQGDMNTVDFRLKPLAVGNVEMMISAAVDETIGDCEVTAPLPPKSDTIIKKFDVEFEGFSKEKTLTKYICADDPKYNGDFEHLWTLEAPQNIVPDSARSWITVVGDLLGSTLENLGNLIRMPYGCGEQNMLNSAPNIYILQYLNSTNQLDKATEDKLIDFMKDGYQRQQKYKRSDGSYSVFGTSDSSGSTWLTAFVVKSFAQAGTYINVDRDDLLRSLNWLISTQQQDGCFESRGFVPDKKIKGGLTNINAKSLSAYIAAALLEAGEDPSSYDIGKALSCLKEGGIRSRDPYELSLIAYALSLAKDPSARTAMRRLLQRATESPDGLHWLLRNSNGKKSSSSLAIETAGYALMAMLEYDIDRHFEKAILIVKWITEKRNSQGGFISTQDTVIALQAISRFEIYINNKSKQVVASFQGTDLNSNIEVTKENSLLNRRLDVNSLPNRVFATTRGSGCILIQGVVRYNVKDPETSEAFNIAVSTSGDPIKCNSKTIKVCASYVLRDGKSNMAVIEISLVSGYFPYKKELFKVVDDNNIQIKRFEKDGRKVIFYVDHFTATETCVEFSVLKEIVVADPKPGTVKIYDYYESEFEITEKYEFTDANCLNSYAAPIGSQRSNTNRARYEQVNIIDFE